MSNKKIIVTNKIACSKTPLELHFKCVDPCKNKYDLYVSKQEIQFKRNNIDVINEIHIEISNPIYSGCNLIDFTCHDLFVTADTEDITIKIEFVDILDKIIDKTICKTIDENIVPEITSRKYFLSIPFSNIDISDTDTCIFVLYLEEFKLNTKPIILCHKIPKCVEICGNIGIC